MASISILDSVHGMTKLQRTFDVGEGSQLLTGRRVVIILPGCTLGGAERQALVLAEFLQREMHANVQIWAYLPGGPVPNRCARYGLPIQIVPVYWSDRIVVQLGCVLKVAWQLRIAGAEIVLPYTGIPNLTGCLAWRLAGARICIWNQRDIGHSLEHRFMHRLSLALASAVVANSNHAADRLVVLGRRREDITIVPNGIVLDNGIPVEGSSLPRAQDSEFSVRVCMLANITRYKDHDTLLRAWNVVMKDRRISQCVPDLLLAGEWGDNYETVANLVAELGIGDSVKLLGRVDDVADLLRTVDIGVYSSRAESCPNGLLECMAAGLPIIGTDTPGIQQAVGPENYAYLSPPGDHEQLGEKIVSLILSPESRLELGDRNRHWIATKFSVEAMCNKTTDLILTKLRDSV